MPFLIPYIVYAVAVVAYYAGPYIFSFAVSFAVSYAINTLLAPKPAGRAQPTGGIAGKQDRTLTFRQPAAPRKLIYGQVRVGGVLAFVHSTDNNLYLHQIIALAGHECEEIGDIYLNDEVVPLDGSGNATGKYAGFVTVKKHLGSPTQLADADLMAAAPSKWSSDHRLRGCAYIYIKFKFSRSIFPSGLPNASAIVKGKKVYDPRSSTTVWSDNAALCPSDYLTDSTYGYGADYATEINEAELIASANICDESIVLSVFGTENRYTCNGVIDSSERPRDVLTGMNSAKAAATINTHGKWVIKAGAYDAPTVSLDENDLRGNIKVVTRVSRNNLFNAVKGVYISAKNSYQPADFPPITNSTYETQDNNERIWRDIDLEFTNTSSTAQRIGKIELEKTRQQIRVELPCKLSALELMAGSNFNFSNARMGWTDKVFEVENWRLEYYNDENGNPALGVLLLVRETASTIFDWNSGEETTTDPAPDTDLPDALSVDPPTGFALASGANEQLVTSDGTVVSRIKATWAAPINAFVDHYEIEYQRTTESERTNVVTSNTEFFIAPVKDGDLYNVRVRVINTLGVRSEWEPINNYLVLGKTDKPPDIISFTIDGNVVRWSTVTVADLAGYVIRYQPGVNTSFGDAVALHRGILSDSPYEMITRPIGTTTLMIKAIDTSGNFSVNSAVIVIDLGDPLVANIIESQDDHAAGFPGTITDGTVDGGSGDLEADSEVTPLMWLDDNRDMWTDDLSLMWATIQYKEMTYLTDLTPTLGATGSILTIAHTIVANTWLIEYRREGASLIWNTNSSVSMWQSDAALMWLLPDFEPWPGSIAVFNDKYNFRFITGASITQGVISELIFNIDVPDIVESFGDVAISASGTRLSLTKTYRTQITVVNVTLQDDGGAAVLARVIDKNKITGPLIGCYDSSDILVAGTIDAIIEGY